MNDERLIASCGLIAPTAPAPYLGPFTITYRVRWPWRRWWLRRHGWSTEWTVEYDPRNARISDVLPAFTADRGGIALR